MADSTNEIMKQSCSGTRETSSQSGYSFRFVDVGKPSQTRDIDSQSHIRSHVMRDFYDRRDNRRKQTTLPEKTSAASRKEGAAQQTHRFRVGSQGLQEIKKRRRKRHNVLEVRELRERVSATSINGAGQPQKLTHDTVRDLHLAKPATTSQSTYSQSDSQESIAVTCKQLHPEPSVIRYTSHHQPRYGFQNHLVPEISVTGSAIDPFNTLPPSTSPRTQILLYHANRGILASRLMGQLRTEWLSLAIQDTAMFHIALSHYAGNYGLAHQQSDPVEALRFRMEAMKLVNERLDIVGNALGDGTLGTVASLSSYEATNGSLSAIRTHMKGLQRLVALRGRLESDINPFTRRLILWADLNCANALGSTPVFDLVDGNDRRTEKAPNSEIPNKSRYGVGHLFPRTSTTNDTGALSMKLRDNFTSLKQLALIDAGTTAKGKDEKIRNSDKLYAMERSLVILSNAWEPGKFARSGCIAAIIFLDNQLRGIGFNARLMDRYVTRLKLSMGLVLKGNSKHYTNEDTAKAILWVLCVGGVAADDRAEREWFVMQLSGFCDTLGLRKWEEAEVVLRSFLWAPSWHYQGKILWNQVEELRLLKNIEGPATDDMIGCR